MNIIVVTLLVILILMIVYAYNSRSQIFNKGDYDDYCNNIGNVSESLVCSDSRCSKYCNISLKNTDVNVEDLCEEMREQVRNGIITEKDFCMLKSCEKLDKYSDYCISY